MPGASAVKRRRSLGRAHYYASLGDAGRRFRPVVISADGIEASQASPVSPMVRDCAPPRSSPLKSRTSTAPGWSSGSNRARAPNRRATACALRRISSKGSSSLPPSAETVEHGEQRYALPLSSTLWYAARSTRFSIAPRTMSARLRGSRASACQVSLPSKRRRSVGLGGAAGSL